MLFGRTQQVAVLERGPAEFISGRDAVSHESLTQRNGCSLIKKDAHLCGLKSRSGGVFQNVTSLGYGNTRKPLDELMDRGIFFEVLEECGNRNPCAAENPRTTYAIRIALDIRAGGPIDHA
jgi:hypothetical protein